ncbi:MAG: hypothetical protein KJ578_05940 [Bacteroidetes bacterium]|nr:hypothetical protein [Bacteroidota bacterium]MBU1578201.1 hypothetical protein [Bacteroidota bacterium]MBU2557302.1 hypothetical protein [Bacteroidota bacterium]
MKKILFIPILILSVLFIKTGLLVQSQYQYPEVEQFRLFTDQSLYITGENSTGRDNPYAALFIVENGRIRSYQYAIIGVPVFTATWIFKTGNYASE